MTLFTNDPNSPHPPIPTQGTVNPHSSRASTWTPSLAWPLLVPDPGDASGLDSTPIPGPSRGVSTALAPRTAASPCSDQTEAAASPRVGFVVVLVAPVVGSVGAMRVPDTRRDAVAKGIDHMVGAMSLAAPVQEAVHSLLSMVGTLAAMLVLVLVPAGLPLVLAPSRGMAQSGLGLRCRAHHDWLASGCHWRHPC